MIDFVCFKLHVWNQYSMLYFQILPYAVDKIAKLCKTESLGKNKVSSIAVHFNHHPHTELIHEFSCSIYISCLVFKKLFKISQNGTLHVVTILFTFLWLTLKLQWLARTRTVNWQKMSSEKLMNQNSKWMLKSIQCYHRVNNKFISGKVA